MRGFDAKCKKTVKDSQNGLNTGSYGVLPSTAGVLTGGQDAGKPCFFVCVLVRGNISTAVKKILY